MATHGQGKAQKKTWKDLSITPWVDPGHRDSLQQPQTKNNKQKWQQKAANPGERGKNLISRVTTLLDSNVQLWRKIHKAYNETEKYGSFKEKKNQQNLSLGKTRWLIY